MQRYFLKENVVVDKKMMLTGHDVHHILNVMRMDIGDKIICVGTNAQTAICEIIEQTNEHVLVLAHSLLDDIKELPVTVTIAQGLPKGKKLEMVIQKGTELGGHHFTLFEGERSVVKWDLKKGKQKLDRYQKVAKEASEQCHRNQIPTIRFSSLANILKESQNYDIMLFAYEETAKKSDFISFSTILKNRKSNDHILIIIGPEGGFSPQEVQLLLEQNVVPVRLGPRILRTETASLYALASISYHFEELRCT